MKKTLIASTLVAAFATNVEAFDPDPFGVYGNQGDDDAAAEIRGLRRDMQRREQEDRMRDSLDRLREQSRSHVPSYNFRYKVGPQYRVNPYR